MTIAPSTADLSKSSATFVVDNKHKLPDFDWIWYTSLFGYSIPSHITNHVQPTIENY